MLLTIEEPLILQGAGRPKQRKRLQQGRLGDPCRKDAVHHHAAQVRLLDAQALEVRLVVEPPAGVIVLARITRDDVHRHLQATPYLAKNFTLKIAVAGAWLFVFEQPTQTSSEAERAGNAKERGTTLQPPSPPPGREVNE